MVVHESSLPLLLAGGALGGMSAAWLFRRTWLATAGAEPNDPPSF
jgi:hypothetical protein